MQTNRHSPAVEDDRRGADGSLFVSDVTTEDGVRLHFEMEGPAAAPAILFVHSLGADGRLWASQARALAGRFRVITYDARGHGRSDAPEGPYTLERLGRDALAVLDAAGAASASICGISIGGAVAQWLGANAPERVERLVLANTAAVFGSPDIWRQRAMAAEADGMSVLLSSTLERWFTSEWRSRFPDALEQIAATFLATSVTGYVGSCEALAEIDLRAALPGIAAPTLVVAGAFDAATPPQAGRALAEAIPAADFVLLNAAHMAPVELPEVFLARVEAFLASPRSAGASPRA